MKTRLIIIASLSLILGLVNLNAMAQSKTTPPPREEKSEPPRREPPPQAYEACKAKKVNEAVEVVTPRGDKIKATCMESPKGLFARPEHPPRHEGDDEKDRKPPMKRN